MAQVSNYLAGVNMAVSVPPVRMWGPRGVDTVNYAGVSLYDRKREMEEDESKRPVTKRRRIRRRRRKQQQQQPTAQQESSRRRRPLLPVRRYEIPKRVVVKYPEHIVREVRLSVLSADKIQRLSQVTLDSPVALNKSRANGAIYDPRMGPAIPQSMCALCGLCRCPGHCGRIELNSPSFHPLFIRTMVKVLRCVCHTCGELMVSPPPANPPSTRTAILDEMEIQSKKAMCRSGRNCPPNATFLTENIAMDGKLVGKTGQVKENYLPTRVRHILEVISKKDAEAMGFINGSHPRDLLCHAIMVPPNNSRQVIGSGLEKFHKPLSDSLNVLLKNRTKDPDQVFKLLRMMLVKSGAKGCVKED